MNFSTPVRKLRTGWTIVRTKGAWETARYVRTQIYDAFKLYADGGFDRRYGTDTTGWIDLEGLTRVGASDIEDCNAYEPTAEPLIHQLLDALPPIQHDRFTFVDYGSGKGRILLVAAEFPFRAIVGVEFVKHFHDIALLNFKRYRTPKQKCFALSSVLMDAADFEPPEGPCVFFLHNPFKFALLTRVMEKIQRSIQEHPREVYVVYWCARPTYIEYMCGLGIPWREIPVRHHYTEATKTRRGFLLSYVPPMSAVPPGAR